MQLRAAFPWLVVIVSCVAIAAPANVHADEGRADGTDYTATTGDFGVSPTGRIEPAGAATGVVAPQPASVTPQMPPMPTYPSGTAAPSVPTYTYPSAGTVAPSVPTYTYPGAYPADEEAPPTPQPIEVAPLDTTPLDTIPVAPAAPPPPGTPAIRAVGPTPAPWSGGQLQRSPNAVWGAQDCVPDCGQKRDNCCWPVDNCGCRLGRWEITIVGTAGWLNDQEGVLGTTAFGFDNQFDWDQSIDYDPAFGARGGIKYAMRPQEWLEVRGGWYGKWDGQGNQRGVFGFQPGNNFVAGGHQRDGVSNDVDGVLTSEAQLYQGEINYVSELSCSGCFRWDLIAGARFMKFDEDSRVDFADAPITGFTGPSFVDSQVENTFIGVQVGANWHWDISSCFNIMATAKVMAGNIRREATVRDQSIFAGGQHQATSEEDQIVLGADIELMGRWKLCRWLTLVGGYNMLILDGVLRGHDAMDFGSSFSGAVQVKQDTDQMIYHGFFAGVQLVF